MLPDPEIEFTIDHQIHEPKLESSGTVLNLENFERNVILFCLDSTQRLPDVTKT